MDLAEPLAQSLHDTFIPEYRISYFFVQLPAWVPKSSPEGQQLLRVMVGEGLLHCGWEVKARFRPPDYHLLNHIALR